MAIDPSNLTPTQLVRLLNSTPLGSVTTTSRVRDQINRFGMRVTGRDGRRINLVRYIAWMAKERRTMPKAKAGQSYADKLRRDLEQKNLASRLGRDIGPPPPIKNKRRRTRCSKSLKAFCETYFSAAFDLKWSKDHLRVIEKIERAVLKGGLFAFAMPRGSGKSSLCRTAAMWAILYGYRDYVCLVGATADLAEDMLTSIKMQLLVNDLIAEDFPEVAHPIRKLENNARKQVGQLCDGEPTYVTWGSDKLVFPSIKGSPSSGAVITVAGLESSIRGQHHTKPDGSISRPSLVLLDDPQTRQSAASRTQTKHRLSILQGDVLGMAGPRVKMAGFLACTKIYNDDLADQMLDPTRNPEWQGETMKLIYEFPTDDKLWDEYAQIRAESLREGDEGKRATAFYRKHRRKMDAGAVVAWPERYLHDELSAIQYAMNLKFRDEEAFFAEYQNEPLAAQTDEELVTPEQVAARFNGRPRKQVPKSATAVTAFIDVQEKMLFYVVCAWDEDFTGYVVDYGAFPDQGRRYFTLREAQRTLAMQFPGTGVEGAIHAGLVSLVPKLVNADWPIIGGGSARIDRLLIDSGHWTSVINAACHHLGGVVMPSKGVGIKAGGRPMSTYKRKPGERHGHHWYVPNVSKTGEFRHVLIDTNYWKTFTHARLRVAPGDRQALTLFGRSAAEHRLFADHIAGSETFEKTEGRGRVVYEWSIRPNKPDNHWFDCLVGCAVAASMQGVKMPDHTSQPVKKRRKLVLSQMR